MAAPISAAKNGSSKEKHETWRKQSVISSSEININFSNIDISVSSEKWRKKKS